MEWLRDGLGLFGAAFGTALLLAAHLPWIGVVLVLRQRLFAAAAVAQCAALGFAVGVFLGLGDREQHLGGCGPELLLVGGAGGVLAGLFVLGRQRSAAGGLEAWAAVLFLIGGSASMLLLAQHPHGLADIQRLQLSSLLGADVLDLLVALALTVATLVLGLWRGRRILLVASDETTAEVLGLHVRAYRAALGTWVGLCLAFAIHTTGLMFAFGCTVLPVLLTRTFAPSLRAVLWLAPILSVGTTGVALWLAQLPGLDWPPGQTTVAIQAGLVGVAMKVSRR
ncbi:MAG: iron chelate uptake ABC transporter family permease subunit [Planctomycetota bacterium]